MDLGWTVYGWTDRGLGWERRHIGRQVRNDSEGLRQISENDKLDCLTDYQLDIQKDRESKVYENRKYVLILKDLNRECLWTKETAEGEPIQTLNHKYGTEEKLSFSLDPTPPF